MTRKPIIAGNWKMFKTASETRAFIAEISAATDAVSNVEIVLFPPFTSLHAGVAAGAGTKLKIGAQNVHWSKEGAFTGEISTAMLTEIPVDYVLIGHSERRQYFAETDATVNARLRAALTAGLQPIVCIGETREEREADRTGEIVERQIKGALADLQAADMTAVTIAYEPVWAIGTGLTATPLQAQEVHALIRRWVEQLFSADTAAALRILYGGSVKPDNAPELMAQADIDGALVGGASLKVEDFRGIIKAC